MQDEVAVWNRKCKVQTHLALIFDCQGDNSFKTFLHLKFKYW